ncbi:MAG: thiamine-phosphate kinase [Thermoanaerobaculia bacterium]
MRGEDSLLAWLRERPGTELLGDDTAALAPPAGRALQVTVDSQIAGVHVPPDLDAAVLARRLLQVNLSDLAAAGAAPGWAVVALATPEGFDHRRFFDALLDACAEEGVRLAGGDLARSPTLVTTLTLVGTRPADRPPPGRGGARPGDALWVGGTLGESGAGQRLVARGARLTRPWTENATAPESPGVALPQPYRRPESLAEAARRAVQRHLAPRAQLALGDALAGRATAAMDLSDGLARDLPRLARESRAGAEVETRALPTPPGFAALCGALEEDPVELALAGGEDYVLLFTLPPDEPPPEDFECHRIGRITEGPDLVLLRDGRPDPWPDLGWDHLA